MTKNFNATSHSLHDTHNIGDKIASNLVFPGCVYLSGTMGAGKTTLISSIIKGLGYLKPVTSPTYNLIQEYPVSAGTVYHMDLYRLQDAEELVYLGLTDLWSDSSLFLIEWPEQGAGFLPAPTHTISIQLFEQDKKEMRKINYESVGMSRNTI